MRKILSQIFSKPSEENSDSVHATCIYVESRCILNGGVHFTARIKNDINFLCPRTIRKDATRKSHDAIKYFADVKLGEWKWEKMHESIALFYIEALERRFLDLASKIMIN